jgi:hypothetical protein
MIRIIVPIDIVYTSSNPGSHCAAVDGERTGGNIESSANRSPKLAGFVFLQKPL